MNKKFLFLYLVAGAIVFATSASKAEDSPHEFTASVALATDYKYRSLSQTNEDPAISGSFDYAHSSGLYAGVWASSLEFGEGSSNDTSVEMNYYGGYAGEIGDGLGFDVGGLYYYYPSTDDAATGGLDQDFFEVYGNLSYTIGDSTFKPTLGAGLAYSPDFYGEDGDGIYVTGTLDIALPNDFALSFLVGNLDVDGDKLTPGGYDYTHYVVGINKSWGKFKFDLSYYDADSDCGGDLCDGVVFTLSSSF